MKGSTKGLLVLGGLAAAGIAAYSVMGAGGDGAAGEGSLGGNDDSLTNEENPFARIDPNAQYRGAQNPFMVTDPETGAVITDNPASDTGGYDLPGSVTGADVPDPGAGGTYGANGGTGGEPWYNTWYGQLGLLTGAGLATEAAFVGAKKGYETYRAKRTEELTGKAGAKDPALREAATDKSPLREKNPVEKIRDVTAGKGDARDPMAKIREGKFVTDADVSMRSTQDPFGRVSEKPVNIKLTEAGAKFTDAKPIGVKGDAAKIQVKTSGAKVGETVGKGLVIGHVIGRSFGAYNEFGEAYLQPRYATDAKGNPTGEVKGATLSSTGKAVAVTGAVASTDIAADLFAFGSGILYRPGTSDKRREGQETGWFATERELWGMIKNPIDAAKGLTGIPEAVRAFTHNEGNVSSGPGTAPSTNSSSQRASVNTPVASAPRSSTQPVNVHAQIAQSYSVLARAGVPGAAQQARAFSQASQVVRQQSSGGFKHGGKSSSSSSSGNTIGAKVGTVFKSGSSVKSSGASGKYRKY